MKKICLIIGLAAGLVYLSPAADAHQYCPPGARPSACGSGCVPAGIPVHRDECNPPADTIEIDTVCSRGMRLNACGKCVPDGIRTTIEDCKPPQGNVCPMGTRLNSCGRCVPAGIATRPGECKPDPVEPPSCPRGMRLNACGKCQPDGMRTTTGDCKPEPVTTCPPTMRLNECGRCVPPGIMTRPGECGANTAPVPALSGITVPIVKK